VDGMVQVMRNHSFPQIPPIHINASKCMHKHLVGPQRVHQAHNENHLLLQVFQGLGHVVVSDTQNSGLQAKLIHLDSFET
jgi:hypothetical protein